MPPQDEPGHGVSGTSEGLRQLIAAGADDRLLDRFMRAKAGGDETTAEAILTQAARCPASSAAARNKSADPLQRVRAAALRPYVNALDAVNLQVYLVCMLEVSEAVVVGLDGRALWDNAGVVDAVADVVRDASVKHLRRCSAWPASPSAAVVRSAHASDDAHVDSLLDEAQFASRLGWSVGRIDRALASSSIFAVPIEGARHFPQFLADMAYSRRHLSAVCRLLGGLSGPSKMQFFCTPKASLGGITPLDALLKRRFAAVCAAAQGYSER